MCSQCGIVISVAHLHRSNLHWLSRPNFPNMKTGVCPLKFPPWCFLRDLKLKYNLFSHKTWKHDRTPLLPSQRELFRLKRSHKLEFPLAWMSKKIDRDSPVRRLSDSMIQVGPSSRRDWGNWVQFLMTWHGGVYFKKKNAKCGEKRGPFLVFLQVVLSVANAV